MKKNVSTIDKPGKNNLKIKSLLFKKAIPIIQQSIFNPKKKNHTTNSPPKPKSNLHENLGYSSPFSISPSPQSKMNSSFYFINRLLKWNSFKHQQSTQSKTKFNPFKDERRKSISYRFENEKSSPTRNDSFKLSQFSHFSAEKTTRPSTHHHQLINFQQYYRATKRVIQLQQAQQKKNKQCQYQLKARYKTQAKPEIIICEDLLPPSSKNNTSPECRPWSGTSINHSGAGNKNNDASRVACR